MLRYIAQTLCNLLPMHAVFLTDMKDNAFNREECVSYVKTFSERDRLQTEEAGSQMLWTFQWLWRRTCRATLCRKCAICALREGNLLREMLELGRDNNKD
eukprot:1633356-Amphidinium_carterae.1